MLNRYQINIFKTTFLSSNEINVKDLTNKLNIPEIKIHFIMEAYIYSIYLIIKLKSVGYIMVIILIIS